MTRLWGRAAKGERVIESVPQNYGDNVTMLASLSLSGIEAPMTISGAVDAMVFKVYVEQVLCPTLKAGDVVVMDNLPAHKVVGKAKAERAGLSGVVEFSQMDAETLEFADESFDVVLSLFALLHFPNAASALKEVFRVLRPGGRLVLAVGSRPPVLSLDYLIQGMRHLNEIKLKRQGKLLKASEFLDTLAKSRLPKSTEPEESELASRSLGTFSMIPPSKSWRICRIPSRR